ncbi:site-specific integrase [Marinobacter sp. Arc7-DN-1]|uniref:site-specific integrase n=1 Tax=Marinobacter sp. Arc7-DN-1 TaxID=2304594 RepID=UPI000E43BA94|nr:site-specific integrase [Marinobacter sp. Arc7-DN-1]AXS84524.1 site-specific integrase [Marinobacter sp. Arc7-DN-1]
MELKSRKNKDLCRRLVQEWIGEASKDPGILYQVKLTDRGNTEVPMVSSGDLGVKIGLSRRQAARVLPSMCRGELDQILEMMRSEGLVTPGATAQNMNHINKLKLFLLRAKKNPALLKRIPMHGRKIQVTRFIHEFPEYEFPTIFTKSAFNRSSRVSYEYFHSVFAPEVVNELKKAGLCDEIFTASNRKPRSEPANNTFKETRDGIDISSVSEFETLCKKPFDSVYFLFALGARGVSSLSAIEQYRTTAQFVESFLRSQGMDGSETVREVLSDYLAVKFRAYLENLIAAKDISPTYGSTQVSNLLRSLQRFSELVGAEHFDFIKASGFKVMGRTTEKYQPYSRTEREVIAGALEKDMRRVWEQYSSVYEPTQSGQTFVVETKSGLQIDGSLCTKENLRWFFDHKLGSKPFRLSELIGSEAQSNEKLFRSGFEQYRWRYSDEQMTLSQLYDSWGVPRNPYREDIFAFYMRLVQVTGMNPMSALDLEVDSFEPKHPATLKPCLRYWKERSSGAKEMHLDIFSSEITWLSASQASKISEIIERVKALTKNLRDSLPEDHENKNLLFIAEAKPPQALGTVLRFYSSGYDKYRNIFETRYINELTDSDTGEMVSIVATRFRASMVSEMIEAGVSVREIQLMMGHSSIKTTLSYLDRMDFNKQSRQMILEKLEMIYNNAWVPQEKDKLPEKEKDHGEVIFKTPLGGCANIFNPPDFIKNSASYDGGACSNFNKCLSCENVIITTSHLPDLFALLRDYRVAWKNGSVAATPYGSVIRENIEILELILGDESEFQKSELEKAERLSRYIDSAVMIDGAAV